jgi:tRNA pseudouridine55 synthase
MATGVLLVLFGDATRCVPYLMDAPKRYHATIRFGFETLTDDAEGSPTRHADVPPLDVPRVAQALEAFVGEIQQVPPAVSALQHEGVRDHERARRGDALERPPRIVTCYGLAALGVEADAVDVDIQCGQGFYVRALARDLGRALGSAAHVAALRRVEAAGYSAAEDGRTLASITAEAPELTKESLIPLAAIVRTLPRVEVDATAARRLWDGQHVPLDDMPPDGRCVILHGGSLVGYARAGDDVVKLERGARVV